MTAAIRRHTVLEQQITEARKKQMLARMQWARSPNYITIASEVAATALLNARLDELCAALRGN